MTMQGFSSGWSINQGVAHPSNRNEGETAAIIKDKMIAVYEKLG
jgi:hypothetical protein